MTVPKILGHGIENLTHLHHRGFMKILALFLCLVSFNAMAWNYSTPIASPITNTTAVAIQPAVVNQGTYITDLQIYNTSATVSSIVTIQSGSTVIWSGYVPAVTTTSPLVPVSINFVTPLRIFAGQAANVVVNTTGANVFVSAQGYFGH